MTARIRPATPDERAGSIRSQWLARVLPRGKDVRGMGVPTGRSGHRVSLGLARRAFELLVEELLAEAEVIVAEVDTELGPQIVGWAAYEPGKLHFVCVPSQYGSRGVGRALHDHAIEIAGHLEPQWETPNGVAWLLAVTVNHSDAGVYHSQPRNPRS